LIFEGGKRGGEERRGDYYKIDLRGREERRRGEEITIKLIFEGGKRGGEEITLKFIFEGEDQFIIEKKRSEEILPKCFRKYV
jgi:hypothetical protein